MDDNPEFKLGQLTAAMDGLEKTVAKLDATINKLDRRVDELRLWKSQVIGMAAAVSALVSLAGTVVPKILAK